MGSYLHQGGRRNTPLRGGERGQSKGQEHVCTCRWSSTPPCVRWSNNFLGLPLAGGVQFKLRPQVGPLSLRGRSLNFTPPASGRPSKVLDHMTRGGLEDH